MLKCVAGAGLWAFGGLVLRSSAAVIAAPAPSPAPSPAAPASANPSIDDAKADFAAGQYQGCLQKISRLLSPGISKPDPATPYDLLMLRGECMMQMKQPM